MAASFADVLLGLLAGAGPEFAALHRQSQKHEQETRVTQMQLDAQDALVRLRGGMEKDLEQIRQTGATERTQMELDLKRAIEGWRVEMDMIFGWAKLDSEAQDRELREAMAEATIAIQQAGIDVEADKVKIMWKRANAEYPDHPPMTEDDRETLKMAYDQMLRATGGPDAVSGLEAITMAVTLAAAALGENSPVTQRLKLGYKNATGEEFGHKATQDLYKAGMGAAVDEEEGTPSQALGARGGRWLGQSIKGGMQGSPYLLPFDLLRDPQGPGHAFQQSREWLGRHPLLQFLPWASKPATDKEK